MGKYLLTDLLVYMLTISNPRYNSSIHPSSVVLILHRVMRDMKSVLEDLGHKVEDTLDGVPTHHRAQLLTHSLTLWIILFS